ncbi:hypothetical protein D3C73_937130 [compost metagenome]
MTEGFSLGGEGLGQTIKRSGQRLALAIGGQADRRGIDVVGGLTAVHMVVGVDDIIGSGRQAQAQKRQVGDDLIGGHVGRSARAALADIEIEGRVVRPRDEFIASADDGARNFRRQAFGLAMRQGGGLLHLSQGHDQLRQIRDPCLAEVEVRASALGLRAMQAVDA